MALNLSMLSSISTSFLQDLELVKALHQTADLQPYQHSNDKMPSEFALVKYSPQQIVFSFIGISLLFIISSISLKKMEQRFRLQSDKIMEIAYQFTNLCVNLFLGISGIYLYNFTLPAMDALIITNRITGFENYTHLAFVQIGYNLWALPVGYFLVNESKLMLGHHVATMFICITSAFTDFGFGYHVPFFFGLIEISSVPLAIMNYCKKNQEWAQEYIPSMKEIIRPIFAATFLTTRVFMWTPNMTDVIRSCILLLSTTPSTLAAAVLTIFTLSALFLSALQLYWGILISKGIIKALGSLALKKDKEV